MKKILALLLAIGGTTSFATPPNTKAAVPTDPEDGVPEYLVPFIDQLQKLETKMNAQIAQSEVENSMAQHIEEYKRFLDSQFVLLDTIQIELYDTLSQKGILSSLSSIGQLRIGLQCIDDPKFNSTFDRLVSQVMTIVESLRKDHHENSDLLWDIEEMKYLSPLAPPILCKESSYICEFRHADKKFLLDPAGIRTGQMPRRTLKEILKSFDLRNKIDTDFKKEAQEFLDAKHSLPQWVGSWLETNKWKETPEDPVMDGVEGETIKNDPDIKKARTLHKLLRRIFYPVLYFKSTLDELCYSIHQMSTKCFVTIHKWQQPNELFPEANFTTARELEALMKSIEQAKESSLANKKPMPATEKEPTD